MGEDPSKYYDETAMRDAVSKGEHRDVIGGLWDEVGARQLDFLVGQGLHSGHRLLDIGCGTFRAGVKLVPYLDPGNYYGIDISSELLQAGYTREIAAAGLDARLPRGNLAVTDCFDVSRFDATFDYAIAQSVFTHLPRSYFPDCLGALGPHFRRGGIFFSTAPHPSSSHPDFEQRPGIVTHPDRDLFHSSSREILESATRPGWVPFWIGDWGHPREQRMLGCVRA